MWKEILRACSLTSFVNQVKVRDRYTCEKKQTGGLEEKEKLTILIPMSD